MKRFNQSFRLLSCLVSCWILFGPQFTLADDPKPAPDHVVIDGVKLLNNQEVEVVGTCLSTDLRFSDAAASLLGLRVNGRANQENIAFLLHAANQGISVQLDGMKKDTYYKLRGKVTDACVTCDNKECHFTVERLEEIPPAPLKPVDFVDRNATFEGTAAANGDVDVHGVRLGLIGVPAWPANIIGKTISVSGQVKAGLREWELEKPTWKLVELADLIGQEVTLAGSLWSWQGHWYFVHRGERLYLTNDQGPPLDFPVEHHCRHVIVSGKLAHQLRPSLHQISHKRDRDLVPTYVLRGARAELKVKPKSEDDRSGTVTTTPPKKSNAVPELIAEQHYPANRTGNETTAKLMTVRNYRMIEELIKNDKPTQRDVLAQRMNDAKVNVTLRMIYAAILANVNDKRGRDYLLKLVEAPGQLEAKDIYYILGDFPFLGDPDESKHDTDCAWAEKTLVAIMAKPETAKIAEQYSSIPMVLCKIKTPAACQVLVEYALATEGVPRNYMNWLTVMTQVCDPALGLPAADLLRLEKVVKDSSIRQAILRSLIKQKHPAVAEKFQNDLAEGPAYTEIRDDLTPDVLEALRAQLPQFQGKAKATVQMWLLLSEKDPVPALIKLLDDPQCANQCLTTFELKRLADPRAVAPLARILREAPKEYFGKDDSRLRVQDGVEHALKTLAKIGSRDAIRELITLLDADLGRFGGYIDRAGNQRIVAAYLIDLTGESFGVDRASWHAWEQAQPDKRFQQAAAKQE